LQDEHRFGARFTSRYAVNLDTARCEPRRREVSTVDRVAGDGHAVNRRTNRARQLWDSRATSWDDQVSASPTFDRVRTATVDAAELTGEDVVVDLGAGTGFLALTCASRARRVIAVDFSREMLRVLEQKATELELNHVEVIAADLADFDLPPNSVDVVVSNYALHHLKDQQKAALVQRTVRWLRPGGRLVITDMMFGRGASPRDREVLVMKARSMLRHGPAGLWRLLKNLVRFGLRVGSDRPAPTEFWIRQLRAAGFTSVESRTVVAEAGLVVGRRPKDPSPLPPSISSRTARGE
jgi:ubiquinone/menaquinone biosynthesis C-methylase UbiE